jgi:tetratricopeptide (TPR) repeat protein
MKITVALCILIYLCPFFSYSQAYKKKIAKEVCECLNSKDLNNVQQTSGQVMLNECIEQQIFKYSNKIEKEYGLEFYDISENSYAENLGKEIGFLMAEDCDVLMNIIKPDNNVNADTFYIKAEKYANEGKNKKAIAYYTLAIKLNSKQSKYFNSRGISYFNQGDYYRAIGDFYRSLELEPENSTIYYNVAYSKFELNDYKSALSELTKSIDLNPEYCIALNLKGLIYDKLNHPDSSLFYFSNAYNYDSTNQTYTYNMGYALFQLEKYTDAIPYFLRTYTQDSTNVTLLSYIGNSYNNLEKYKEALVYHNKCIALEENNDYTSYYNRGLAYYNLKFYDEAIKDFSKAHSIDSTDLDILFYLVKNYLEIKDYNSAIEYANNLISKNTSNPNYYDLRASIYKETSQFKLAIQDYMISVNLYPDDCQIHSELGRLYELVGMETESENAYKTSTNLGCNNSE